MGWTINDVPNRSCVESSSMLLPELNQEVILHRHFENANDAKRWIYEFRRSAIHVQVPDMQPGIPLLMADARDPDNIQIDPTGQLNALGSLVDEILMELTQHACEHIMDEAKKRIPAGYDYSL